MMQHKFFLISIFIFFIYNFSLGQENCSNGIDDDLDGLIDLNDPECDCNGISISTQNNSIPNPSFEQYKNCAHFWNDGVHNGYIESEISNWQRGNAATCDYYNCGFQNQIELTPPATPYPNGTGYVGIGNGHDFSIGNIWKEYIGTLLSNPLPTGNNYEFSYYISGTSGTGLIPPLWYAPYYNGTSNADVEIVIYGYESISLLSSFPQTPGYNCPTSTNPNWVVLGSEIITTTPNSWVQGNIQFTTTANIQAIMIGFNCNGTIGGMTQINTNTGHNGRWDYYYIDDLKLFEENYIASPNTTINVTGNSCEGNKIASFTNTTSSSPITGYQWYENGIALIGATNSTLNLSNLPNGQYELVTYYADGNCSRSNQIQHTLPSLPIVGISSSNDTINCLHSTINLNGSGGSLYFWTTNDGSIVSGQNTANPIVDENGTYLLTVTDINGCNSIDSITIFRDIVEPTVTISPSFLEINCDQPTINLEAIGTADFFWTTANGNIIGNTNQASITIDQSGYYLVTATGSNGCTSQDSILIQQNLSAPSLSTTISNPELNCIDTVITLTANGGTSYTWNTLNGNILSGFNTSSISIDNAGDYEVIVTGNNGCKDSTEITITSNTTSPNVNINALTREINCTDTSINLIASGGEFYNWTTINGNITSNTNDSIISINSGGLYLVEAIGLNGCISNAMFYVSSNASFPVININSTTDTLTCDSTLSSISATGGNSFTWTTNNGNILSGFNSSNIVVNQPGTYLVEVIGVNGCVSKDSITIIEDITPPNINITSLLNTIDCINSNITLNASGGTNYFWNTINGNITSVTNTNSITIDEGGSYTVYSQANNGCLDSAQITINEDLSIPNITLNSSNPSIDCNNSNVSLEVFGAQSYLWSTINGNILNANNDSTIWIDQGGTYNIIATGSNGCISLDSVTIAWDTVGFQIDAGPDTTICPGDHVLLNMNNSTLSYQWNQSLGSGESHLVNPIVDTEYIVTATSPNGCTTIDTINIYVNDSLQIGLHELIIINENCSMGGSINGIIISGGNPSYSYTWLNNNQFISNSLNIQDLSQGEYQLEIHDSIGCMTSTIFNIGFNDISTVIAQNDYNQTPFQTPVSTMVDLNDIGDINTITILTHPSNGNAINSGNGEISYEPNNGFFGIDSLEYSICDSLCINQCEKAWLIIEVERVQKVEIPNGVSPNGDGLNDFFEIQHIEYFPENKLVIFNRWGDIIYQVSPYQNDWYGQNENTKFILRGEQVVDGSYFYILNLGDGSDPINGFIEVRSQ